MEKWLILILLAFTLVQTILGQPRIIDMHMHSYGDESFITSENGYMQVNFYGIEGSPNASVHFQECYQSMIDNNIQKAVVSGTLESVENWKSKDRDNRIIRGIMIDHPDQLEISIQEFEQLIVEGKLEVFGELGPYYTGTTLSDSIWQPYLKLCEKYDIPVGVHTGGGGALGTSTWSPRARLKLGNPYLIEDVLVRYPNLRIYIMHAGASWHEHALRLMAYYPQLYTDISAMLWVEPLTQRYVRNFLRNAKEAGYLDRVMFGSDQMRWPYAIKKSIDFLNSIEFLTQEDRNAIFYDNAAKFLNLDEPNE